MFYIVFYLVLYMRSSVDVVFIDGVSAPMPLLSLCGIPTLFYCHFPDKVRMMYRRNQRTFVRE
jgi:hypothetical protein